jgi:hypothetical protein
MTLMWPCAATPAGTRKFRHNITLVTASMHMHVLGERKAPARSVPVCSSCLYQPCWPQVKDRHACPIAAWHEYPIWLVAAHPCYLTTDLPFANPAPTYYPLMPDICPPPHTHTQYPPTHPRQAPPSACSTSGAALSFAPSRPCATTTSRTRRPCRCHQRPRWCSPATCWSRAARTARWAGARTRPWASVSALLLLLGVCVAAGCGHAPMTGRAVGPRPPRCRRTGG